MPVLTSQIDTRDARYQTNREHMLGALADLDTLLAQAAAGGGADTLARLRKRGKLPLRERIALVLTATARFLKSARWLHGVRRSTSDRASWSASA